MSKSFRNLQKKKTYTQNFYKVKILKRTRSYLCHWQKLLLLLYVALHDDKCGPICFNLPPFFQLCQAIMFALTTSLMAQLYTFAKFFQLWIYY